MDSKTINNKEDLYAQNSIRTYTGLYMNISLPTLEMVCIEDIAHGLSNQCRFGGHLPEFYSVAQHCVLCSELADREYRLQALMHDASEAYLIDIPTPIKRLLTNYKELEDDLMSLIAKKFNFSYPLNEHVKQIDQYILQFEWDNLMIKKPRHGACWTNTHAKQRFLETYETLSKLIQP